MAKTKQCCRCCGNCYESGGGCDCDRNLKRIAALAAACETQGRANGDLSTLNHRLLLERDEALAKVDQLTEELASEAKCDSEIQEIIKKYMDDAEQAGTELAEERARLNLFEDDRRLCLMYIPEAEALRPGWEICTYDEEFGPNDTIAHGDTVRAAIDAAKEKE